MEKKNNTSNDNAINKANLKYSSCHKINEKKVKKLTRHLITETNKLNSSLAQKKKINKNLQYHHQPRMG